MRHFAQFVRRTRLTGPQVEAPQNIESTDPDQYGSPWDKDMRAAWAPGGDSLGRYNGFVNAMDWYKQYLRGPVDDGWYESLFDMVPEGKWPVDFSTTNYLVNDAGFARMSSFTQDSRAILILRDPIERLWSHVKFHAEITGDLDKLPHWGIDELRNFIAHFKLDEGSYYESAIQSLFAHFPPERRMVINFEDLRNRPEALFSEVLGFLDLEDRPLPQRGEEAPLIAASQPLPMPRGLAAHLAEDFERDLRAVADLGVEFVQPWITNAMAHANERPLPQRKGKKAWLRSLVGK